ncbi:conjugal transfer protein TraG N-terminal domain-containing protein [Ideonella sp. 4Y16]|uniref:Conjugal transfer protein TraG N-terminal domain-containing protein n=1 Tax=Ideonella aquatica TaxID=2824119 RepID=A0A940YLE5_9BURK|nr:MULTISPECIES: conjugal transfer protein TraG N-terminal domain-containing protein [Ideonella]MBQ0946414.1 conjugal transfer protein TraG N-terminal domain-containing protein [Ideonella alba]MBQ0961749.1 conjugal transfer protein TraG N-terminal domain-containing protein [Ideonella aquatica]
MVTQTLTIYAYGNVDALHGILNAIAMVMSANDFADMIRVAVIVGFVSVAILAMLPGNLQKGWNWFMTVAVLSGVLLVPKANVSIEDKLGLQPPVVVQNVPWGLALLGTVKSSIGSTLTQMFETAFQTIPGDLALPAELGYLEHGVLFGNRLVRASREAEFTALVTQSDTLNYLRNCVFPTLAREANPGAFERSPNLLADIEVTNPALFSPYHDSNGDTQLGTCPEVYGKLHKNLMGQGRQALEAMAQRLYPGQDSAQAIAKAEGSLLAIYGKSQLANVGLTAAEVMVQNILINATADASALYGASLDDPALMMFASMRSQAIAQTNAGWLVQGRIAEEVLPLVRNVTEAILYAMFPVLCILAVASEGQALAKLLKGYILVMIWVELWPPMFAVVNYLQTLESAKSLAAAAAIGGTQALSLQSATGIYSTAISEVAVASWMVTFVPVLAAAILLGFEKVMAVAGASGVGGGSAASSTAAQGAHGNLQLGNMSYGQQELSEYRSDSAVRRTSGLGGQSATHLLSGETIDQYAQSSGPVSVKDSAGWGQRMSESAAAATEQATQHQKAYEASLGNAFTQALTLARTGSAGATRGLGFDVSTLGDNGLATSDTARSAERIAKQFGIADSSAVQKALTAGVGAPIPVLSFGGKLSTQETEQLSNAIQSERSSLHDLSVQRQERLVNAFRSGSSFESTRRSNREAADRIDASMRDAATSRELASASLAESRRYQEASEKYEAFSRSGEANWANEFYQFARARGVEPSQGRASTAHLKSLLQEFVASGEVFKSDAGESFWVPHQGQGPNVQQDRLNFTPAALRSHQQQANPGGGRQAVELAHEAGSMRVQAGWRQQGVSPAQAVGGSDLGAQVAAGQGGAQQASQAARAKLDSTAGATQVDWDSRIDSTSTGHDPVYSSNPITQEHTPNKAQKGVHSPEASTFPQQAENVRKAKAADAEAKQEQMGVYPPRIPTGPNDQ